MAPGALLVSKEARREVGDHARGVVVAPDPEHEADLVPDRGREGREQRRAHRVAEGPDPRLALGGEFRARDQVGEGVRHLQDVVRPDLEGAQAWHLGHQDREARSGEGTREGHQARVVLARPCRAGHQHDPGPRLPVAQVQIPRVAPACDRVAHRHSGGGRGPRLERARLFAGGDVAQDPQRLAARQAALQEHERGAASQAAPQGRGPAKGGSPLASRIAA
ncbi:hypothetical protein D3C86_1291140 [compost metagenome]